jgi:tetratricopeptide (TPR) repeat protein
MKIFLSHSSSDKDIVERVFKELGAGICHYDVATFDPTGFLPEQIYSALAESTHFVLFASDKALNSGWVEGELKTLFINWMSSKTAKAMVFLLRGGDRSLVPSWLQNYVITEHPTPSHIACRILSEYDNWQINESNVPPFYRSNELKNVETQLLVEASKMPTCLIICGPDGFGRKELINQIFSRNFRNISLRKIHIYTENFDSDVDFYRSLKGVFSLTTARELVNSVEAYKNLPLGERLDQIVELIQKLCSGSQTIILDATDSIFNDSGEILDWMEQLIRKLPSTPYPYLNITANRRPNYIKSYIAERTVICYLDPLSTEDSSLLFRWWLSKFDVSLPNHISELIFEQVTGNPKQIESAVRLLKNIPDVLDIKNIKINVFADLERNVSKLLTKVASDDLSRLILSLVADCGHIAQSDLLTIVTKVTDIDNETIIECYKKLHSYGFLQSDAICIKVPNFLSRTAKSLGKAEPINAQLKLCWSALAESIEKITYDSETSYTILNEACILKLKSGVNSITGIESLILPSQCIRTARQLYDSKEYLQAYKLNERAFQARLALTDDGAIEALRYCGMSAARLNKNDLLMITLANFKEYAGNIRAQRIAEFIRGFNYRLAGKFDEALTHMQRAVGGGAQDIHVFRELSFLYLSTNDPQKAKIYISKAIAKARNNSYILELQILTELAFGKGYVIHNDKSILELIDVLENIDMFNNKSHVFRAKIEYLLTRGDTQQARELFDGYNKNYEIGIVPKKLLEAKLLIAESKFYDAVNVLNQAKNKVFESRNVQRRSVVPMIAELLIHAASGVSISNGIIEFKHNKNYLPSSIREKIKLELSEQVAYSQYKLSAEERKILNL